MDEYPKTLTGPFCVKMRLAKHSIAVIARSEFCDEATPVHGWFGSGFGGMTKGLFNLGLPRRKRPAIRGTLLAMTSNAQTKKAKVDDPSFFCFMDLPSD